MRRDLFVLISGLILATGCHTKKVHLDFSSAYSGISPDIHVDITTTTLNPWHNMATEYYGVHLVAFEPLNDYQSPNEVCPNDLSAKLTNDRNENLAVCGPEIKVLGEYGHYRAKGKILTQGHDVSVGWKVRVDRRETDLEVMPFRVPGTNAWFLSDKAEIREPPGRQAFADVALERDPIIFYATDSANPNIKVGHRFDNRTVTLHHRPETPTIELGQDRLKLSDDGAWHVRPGNYVITCTSPDRYLDVHIMHFNRDWFPYPDDQKPPHWRMQTNVDVYHGEPVQFQPRSTQDGKMPWESDKGVDLNDTTALFRKYGVVALDDPRYEDRLYLKLKPWDVVYLYTHDRD